MSPPFHKVLVANRGEIAGRVFATCAERGIRTVAIYSEPDAAALHTSLADEAVSVGPAPSRESYLVVDKVVAAAQQTGADAIHPGYGFLSENPALVRACEAAGITFVGPPTRAMDVMGDKVRARQAMIAAGVPVVPGREDLASAEEALAAAREVGFPVMLKASAGGGGKGMRIVHDEAELPRAFAAAVREAEGAFGDGRMFLERAVMRARHVEIQVMADAHGACVYLGERDCSVQRRHQKIIEEAPSPSPQMSPEVRARMGEVACRAAQAVDYRGAGTVEFLFEETGDGPRFYFLEMNTRLQVEHPVTEMITGRDLVWDQLRVAAGQPLGYTQADVRLSGHAIECRIYAEDPVRFLPSPGILSRLRWPTGPGIRVDAAVVEGSEVSSHYDPMIAKIVAWGHDRPTALARMGRALEQTAALGIATNVSLHQRVLSEPDFVAGAVTTRYVDEHPAVCEPLAPRAPAPVLAAAAAAAAASRQRPAQAGPGAGHDPSPGAAPSVGAAERSWPRPGVPGSVPGGRSLRRPCAPVASRRSLAWRPILPGQDLARLVPEGAGRLQGELVDPSDEPRRGRVGVDEALAAGHVGAHEAGVQDGDGELPRAQIVGQGGPRHVERGLGHAVAIVAARRVVRDGAHAAGEQGDLPAGFHALVQGRDHAQGAEGVDLELPADAVLVHGVHKGVARQGPRHDPQAVQRSFGEPGAQGLDASARGHVHLGDDLDAGRGQVRRGGAACGDDGVAAPGEGAHDGQADTAVGSNDEGGHGGRQPNRPPGTF